MSHTILLVDDEPNVLQALMRVLARQPYKVFTACSALEAVEVLKARPVDLIISDEGMPGMSGTEFLAWVAVNYPHVGRIVLTGQPSVPTALRAINHGRVHRFLTKPCDPIELALSISRTLDQKDHWQRGEQLFDAALERLREVERARRAIEQQISELQGRIAEVDQARNEAERGRQHAASLLAGVSHDLRTPLTSILGYADELIDECWGRSAVESLHVIRRNGEHLLLLINSLVDLSKAEAGQFELLREPVPVVDLVEEVVDMLRVLATKKGLELTSEYVAPLPETIQSDATRLRQILFNLVTNAVKFTAEGCVRVVVRHTKVHDERDAMEFSVIDTGVGMSAEQIDQLFQPFVQDDSRDTQRVGGTGLGLTIAKCLTELLGGDLVVRSEPDQGSSFTAVIPAGSIEGVPMIDRPQAARRQRAASDQLDRSTPQPTPGRILLAGDDQDSQNLISQILRKAGAEVVLAENGAQAIDRVLAAIEQGRPFDLVLMEIDMPLVDGIQATRTLRERGFAGRILMLTAHTDMDHYARATAAGSSGCLTKPIDRETLLTAVARSSRQDGDPVPVVSNEDRASDRNPKTAVRL